MAQLVLGAVGAVVGFYIGGPTGAQIGFALGSAAGSTLGPATKVQGPRLSDLKSPQANYGSVIPYVEGTVRTAGVWAWNSDKRETATTTEQGGKGGPSTETTTYSYDMDALIILADNEMAGIRRVWANGKLVWSLADTASDATVAASGSTEAWSSITFYRGDASQLPDPTYEAAVGVGNAPAYRGRAYVMIQGLNLGGSGQVPMLSFEVFSSGFAGGSGLSESFADGTLDAYTAVNGTKASFAVVTGGLYGNEVYSGPGTAFQTQTISRILPSAFSARYFEFVVCVTESKSDDATLIYFKDSQTNTINFNFLPYREGAYDSARRPHVSFGGIGLQAIGTVAFTIGTYYRVVILSDEVAGQVTCTITEAATGTAFATKVLSNTAPEWTIDEIRFEIDNNANTSRTKYADITVGGSRAQVVAESLDDVVTRQCARAGIGPSQIDVSDLSSVTVRGFAVSQVTPVRTVIEMLGLAYQFDAFESDGKIKFRRRGISSVATIDHEDLGASDSDVVEPLPFTRASDLELPSEIVVKYANALNDLQDAAESVDRMLSTMRSTEVTELAMVLSPQEARRVAEIRANDIVNSVVRVEGLSLLRNYARLEPCDPITVVDEDGSTYRLRVLRIQDGVVRKIDAAVDDASVSTGVSVSDEAYVDSTTVAAKTGTILSLLDIPILRDSDDDIGHYAAVAKASNEGTWPGAALFRGQNDAGYESVATFTNRTYIGTVSGALGDFSPGSTVFDEVNTLSVVGFGTLESYTRDQILDGTARPLLVGAEVLYYRDAVVGVAGTYTISGLLRGQRGTEWAISGHSASETAVQLKEAGLRRVEQTTGQVGVSLDYKAATNGSAVDTITPTAFTNTSIGKRPFSPVDLRASRDSLSGLTLTWKRRTRRATRFVGASGISVPLGETSEAYEVDIMSGSTVKRTISTTSATATYTSSQQQADFGSVQTSVSVRIYQVSSIYGRGKPLEATVTTGGFVAAAYESLISLAGTFTTGITLTVNVGEETIGSHTVVGGDTDLRGVATALAAAINAHPDYDAFAVGANVEIDGPAGIAYELTVDASGTSTISSITTQTAVSAGSGSAYVANVYVSQLITGVTEPVPSGTTFTVIYQRPIYTTVGSISFTTSGSSTREDVLRGLADQASIKPGGALYELGYRFQVSVGAFGYFGVIFGPFGAADVYIGQSATGGFGLTVSVTNPGSAPIPADLPQISKVTIGGTPVVGEVFRVFIPIFAPTPFEFTAATASASDVATGLAALIDADADFTATASGAEITITSAATGFGAAFNIATSIDRAITDFELYQYNGGSFARQFRGDSPMLFAASGGNWFAYTDRYMSSSPGGGGGDYRPIRMWKASSRSGPFAVDSISINETVAPGSAPLMLPSFGRIAQTSTYCLRFDGADTSPWNFARVRFDGSEDPAVVESDLGPTAKPISMVSDGSRIVLLAADLHAYSTTDGETWTDLGAFSGAGFPITPAFNNTQLLKIGSRWWLIIQNSGGFSGEVNSNILFYNDSADPVGAWTTAGQPSYTRAPALNVHEEMVEAGGDLHLFVNTAADVLVFVSSDNGATWSQEATLSSTNVSFIQLTTGSPAYLRVHNTTFHEKEVGTTTWTSMGANGLNGPFYAVTVDGATAVADNRNGPFEIGNYAVMVETDGYFGAAATGF